MRRARHLRWQQRRGGRTHLVFTLEEQIEAFVASRDIEHQVLHACLQQEALEMVQAVLDPASTLPHLHHRSPGVVSVLAYTGQALLGMHDELHHDLLLQLDLEDVFLHGDGDLDSLAVRLGPYPDAVHDAATVPVAR